MQQLNVIEVKGQRVLTTKQLAEAYQTESKIITNNFNRNKNRYIAGKHYIYLSGKELKECKAKHQFDVSRNLNKLYLWTERGALLHAKSLNTEKAWEVYDYLVDFYFRVKETPPEIKKTGKEVVDAPENAQIIKAVGKVKDDLTCMNVLLDSCMMYLKEDDYKARTKAAGDVIGILINDCEHLRTIKPNIVLKHY